MRLRLFCLLVPYLLAVGLPGCSQGEPCPQKECIGLDTLFASLEDGDPHPFIVEASETIAAMAHPYWGRIGPRFQLFLGRGTLGIGK